jgi:cardiolipin synthase
MSFEFWEVVLALLAAAEFLVLFLGIPWVVTLKRESHAALAWSLTILLLPIIGFLFFLLFGYNYVHRPLKRKRRHRAAYRLRAAVEAVDEPPLDKQDETWNQLGSYAGRLGAFPVSRGNEVTFYTETKTAFDEMFEAMEAAQHHIHVESYIVQSDKTGGRLLELLARKAKAGVAVRLLYDAVGSFFLRRRLIKPLCKVGGHCRAFLSVDPFRRRFQMNMRNHRKIIIVDGRIGFTGGINIGDEYLGKDPRFGYWRDQHLRLEGPAVAGLRRVFIEDWDFATKEELKGEAYFPNLPPVGDAVVQVVESGPDQEKNANRELIYAGISLARQRLWIATPYFVPDRGILDALRMAARLGVDVRILLPLKNDATAPHFAGMYYVADLLDEGIKFYQYARGMMHSKMMAVDGAWGWVGSANLDNRSLYLNFETNLVLHSPATVQEVEAAFEADFRDSVLIDPVAFAARPFSQRLWENCFRLLSPLL